MNLYEILGVSQNANPEEIKKAYRLKAKEHHPDVNDGDSESVELIKLINQAYEVLSDENLRARYDSEISITRSVSRWMVPLDLRVGLPVELSLAFLGGKKSFAYLRTSLYHGNPVVSMATISVDIPRRCRSGTHIKVSGAGNMSKVNDKAVSGDLYLMVHYAAESEEVSVDRFGNVYAYINLTLQQVLKGGEYLYHPFDGKEGFPIKLDSKNGQGHTYCIKEQGFLPNSSLFVKVFYDFPTNMSVEDKDLITKILDKYGNT